MKGLSGSLKTMSIQDVIQWFNISLKTGTLVLKHEYDDCCVYFNRGIIIAASTKNPRLALGQILKRQGLITENQIDKVRLIQEKTHEIFGSILLELGLLDEQQLLEAVKTQTEEIIFSIFEWEDGEFEFIDGQLPSYNFIPVNLVAHNLIIEDAKRKDEWAEIKKVFPTPHIVLKLTDKGQDIILDLEPHCLESEVMTKIDGKRSIEEIISQCGASDYGVFKFLEKSLNLGDLEVVGVKQPEQKPDNTAELLKKANILKSQGYLAEAILTLKQAYESNPENETIKKELEDTERKFEQTMVETIGNLDRIPVLLVAIDSKQARNMTLSAEEGFLLSRIDNYSTIKQIISVSGMKKDQVLRGLYKFLKQEVVGFQDQKSATVPDNTDKPVKLSQKLMQTVEMEFNLNGIKRTVTPKDQMEMINYLNSIKEANYFTVLNVTPSSSKSEIIDNFKELAIRYYPAQFMEVSPFFSMKLKTIVRILCTALDTITSKNKRAQYIQSFKT